MQWWESPEDAAPSQRYRIERKIGEGGMAEVFLARQEPLGRKVAIKVPKLGFEESPHMARRFRREVERQDHERIVGVIGLLDAGEWAGSDGRKRPYLVMEYVSGGSLGDMLGGRFGARQNPQSIDEVLVWLVPIAATLDRLHGRGLLHRDVKPDNILFNADGDPLLSDFGIATTLDEGQGNSEGSSTSLWVVGSPGYMSPEIVASEKAAASDQFSLGITVYEALSGRLPMIPKNLGEWMQALANWHPEHLSQLCPGLHPAVADAVMKAISNRGGDRFPNCAAFATRVHDALSEKPVARAPLAPATQVVKVDEEVLRAGTVAEGWRFVAADGTQQGPVAQDALRNLFARGQLNATTLIWASGLSQWREYGSVFGQDLPPPLPGNAGSSQDIPPPLPGAGGTPLPQRVQGFAVSPSDTGPGMRIDAVARHDGEAIAPGAEPMAHQAVPAAGNAGMGLRLAARVIDAVLFFIAILPFGGSSNERAQDPDSAMVVVLALMGFGAWLLLTAVQAWFLTKDGQSLGKKAVGIRIVNASDGGNPGFARAFLVREIGYVAIAVLSTVTFGLPLLVDLGPILGADRRCMHDYVTGTRVVMKRVSVGA